MNKAPKQNKRMQIRTNEKNKIEDKIDYQEAPQPSATPLHVRKATRRERPKVLIF